MTGSGTTPPGSLFSTHGEMHAQERINAARDRLTRVSVRLQAYETVKFHEGETPSFVSEIRLLREALDLLDPGVSLA